MKKISGKTVKDLRGKIENSLELPSVPLSASVHIELNGNREGIVDGCRGVIEYGDSEIKLNAGRLIVCFKGEGLMIKTLRMNCAVVCGNITSVDFST